jgi:hypothetical protein
MVPHGLVSKLLFQGRQEMRNFMGCCPNEEAIINVYQSSSSPTNSFIMLLDFTQQLSIISEE